MLYRKLLYTVIVISLAFSQYDYSLEDINPNSATFGTNVWHPDFSDYITLHYLLKLINNELIEIFIPDYRMGIISPL